MSYAIIELFCLFGVSGGRKEDESWDHGNHRATSLDDGMSSAGYPEQPASQLIVTNCNPAIIN